MIGEPLQGSNLFCLRSRVVATLQPGLKLVNAFGVKSGLTRKSLTTDMHNWSLIRILFGLAEDLVCHRRCVTFTKCNVLE